MDIGEKLKSVRKSMALSQRELAARADMTSGAISLMEQNKASPSVASLKRILDAVPMTLSEFFSDLEDLTGAQIFFKKSDFTEISPSELQTQCAQNLLSLRQLGDASGAVQMLYETYQPGADTGAEMLSHDGEEAGIVVEGQINVTVGAQTAVLGPGDGYVFDSTLPHRFRNTDKSRCIVISACTPPSF